MTAEARSARGNATRAALMRAAERLIAEHGVESVSIRQIVTAAGQKNQSALQYHFGDLAGLIGAIHRERAAQLEARRAQLVAELLRQGPPVALRDLCAAMIRPAFDLARSSPDFHCYLRAFGHEMALADSTLALSTRSGGDGMQQLTALLRDALPHLQGAAYRRRMELAARLCATAMYHRAQAQAQARVQARVQARPQARPGNGFRGTQGQLFIHSLLDALTGLLSAPESEQTRRLATATTGRKE